jgi:hypothetical protein
MKHFFLKNKINFGLIKGMDTPIILAILFVFCYLLTFPKTFLISDEWGYVGRAMAMVNGDKTLIFNDLESNYHQDLMRDLSYPLGTSYFLSVFIFLFGKKMCFLMGLFSLLMSQFLMSKMLIQLKENTTVLLITWCCLPCLIMSRTAMSDMPALLMSALFFYCYFKESDNRNNYFLLGFLGGLSVLFRENLIVLFAFFLLKLFFEGTLSKRFLLAGAFLLGIFIRLLSANYFYGDPFYYKLTTPFNTYLFFYNLLFYACSLTVVFPLASFALFQFKNVKEGFVIKLTVVAYLLFFSFYAYNGLISGFLRSVVLTNRFFMPLLPLFMVAYAQFFGKMRISFQKIAQKGLLILGCVMIVGSQMTAHYFEEKNLGIVDCTKNSPILIVSPKVTCAKYINGMTADSQLIPNEACENNPQIVREIVKKQGFCDLFELDRPMDRDSMLSFKKLFINQEMCSFTTPDGFTGRVIRLK